MKKLHFYGGEDTEVSTFVYQFPYLKDLNAWIDAHPFSANPGIGRYPLKATHGAVKRAKRIIFQHPHVKFPVEIN
jgi:hypothetical protein